MAAYTGLFKKIKDKSFELKDRLKLVHFAWCSDLVSIPNKHSVLIDSVSGLLVNRKKNQLSDDDVVSVWWCLRCILYSQHWSTDAAKSILVKPSLGQVLVETLQRCVQQTSDKTLLSHAVDCCHMIITSQHLSHLLTAKYETLASVLCSVSQLCLHGDGDSQTLYAILSQVMSVYPKIQAAHNNQKQVLQMTVDKLLVPVILFSYKQSTLTTNLKCEADILPSVFAALFNSSHREMYKRYLMSKGGDKPGSDGVRPLENLFSHLKTLLDGKVPQGIQVPIEVLPEDAVCHFLPLFLAAFLKVHDKTLCQKMFQHLCNLIGLDQDGATCWSLEESKVIKVVNALLSEVYLADIYSVARDNEAGGHQLKFYRHLSEVILNLPVEADWYNLAVTLLQMNHGILEPRIKEILVHGWLRARKLSDTSHLSKFLSELFSTYGKLRQMPKLFTYIMAAIQSCDGQTISLLCPTLFAKRLHEIVQGLPQTTTVDIWAKLLEDVKSIYIAPLTDSDTETDSRLSCMLSLVRLFLGGIKMADYSITDVTAKKVHQLMTDMETDIFQPLYELKMNQDQNVLGSLLYLSYIWGELKVLLALYDKKYRASTKFGTDTVSHPSNICFIHTYLSSDGWRKIHKKATKSGNSLLQYLFELLTVQKVKALLLFSKDDGHSNNVQSALDLVIQSPTDVNEEQQNALWDGEESDIRGDNYVVPSWQTIMHHLPVLAPIMSTEQCDRVAQFVIDTFSSQQTSSCSLSSVTRQLLSSPVTMETRKLQSSIISLILKTLNASAKVGKSPKKRKHSSKVTMVTDGLMKLSEMDGDCEFENFTGVASLVDKVLKEDETHTVELKQQQKEALKILECLPLEYLSASERVRCFLGLTLLASVTSQLSVIHLMTVLLDGSGHIPVFTGVNPSTFLMWTTQLCGQIEEESQKNSSSPVLVLVESACRVIIRDSSLTTAVKPFIKQLGEDLESCTEQLQQRKIQRASLPDRAKFTVTGFLLRYLTMQLRKMSFSIDQRESYRELFNTLSSAITRVLQALRNVKSTKRVISPSSHLIGCFNFVLHQSCVDLVKKSKSKVGDSKEDQELEQDVIESTDFILERIMADIESGNIEDVGQPGLEFLQTVCKHHSRLQTLLTEAMFNKLWNTLFSAVVKSHDRHKLTPSEHVMTCDSCITDTVSMDCDDVSGGVDDSVLIYHRVKKLLDLEDSECSLDKETRTSCGIIQGGKTEGLASGEAVEGSLSDNLQETLAAVITSCHFELYKNILEHIVSCVSPAMLQSRVNLMMAAMTVWEKLLARQHSDKQSLELTAAAQHMMMNYQSCLEWLHCLPPEDTVHLAVLILRSQTAMLNYGYKLIPRQTSVLCLHGSRTIPLEGSTYREFIPACTALQDMLLSLMMHHPNAVLSVIPSFVTNIKTILVSVIQHGNQDRLLAEPQFIDAMVTCASRTTRLLSLLEPHKKEFSKVVVYILADFAHRVQEVTLLPAVKKALLPGIYILLDLADRFQISQLLTILPHGTKDIFKLLYTDYTKYHKYSR